MTNKPDALPVVAWESIQTVDGEFKDACLTFRGQEPKFTILHRQVVDHNALVRQAGHLKAIAQRDAELSELRRTIAGLRQHKNEYMDAAEETRKALTAERDTLQAELAAMRGGLQKLHDVAKGCFHIASSYSGCIDGVEEHGGDDHEDPSCAIYHRLYYALFDSEHALKASFAPSQVAAEVVRPAKDEPSLVECDQCPRQGCVEVCAKAPICDCRQGRDARTCKGGE